MMRHAPRPSPPPPLTLPQRITAFLTHWEGQQAHLNDLEIWIRVDGKKIPRKKLAGACCRLIKLGRLEYGRNAHGTPLIGVYRLPLEVGHA